MEKSPAVPQCSATMCCKVLRSTEKCYKVLQSAKWYKVLKSSENCYKVLQSATMI